MKLHNFNAAYPLAMSLYGCDIDPILFEDIGLNGWEQINTKHTRLYKYKGNTINCKLELPCNLDIIESVHLPIEDAQMTSNKTVFNSVSTLFFENYIEAWKHLNDPLYHRGKLVKYHESGNMLEFSRDYKNIIVIYHGVLMDEDGLPLLNDKELRAIAAYIAYATLHKESLIKRDSGLFQMAQAIKVDWLRYCNAARIPDHLSQNDMNSILDVKTRWDRKQYGKSMKPIL